MEAPPLGIMPHKFWVEKRVTDIIEAAARFRDAGVPVPQEWLDEYGKLIEELD
jgi:hypothetical protein